MAHTVPAWFWIGARIRSVATTVGLLGIVVGVVGGLWLPDRWVPDVVAFPLGLGGFVLLMVGSALTLAPAAPRIESRPVGPVVAGRWRAVNSPASKVPSHRTHGHGQTFAVDLAYEPAEGTRPQFGHGPPFRPPQDYPGYGQPVYAPKDARVVAVRDRAREHRSRSTMLAYAYLMVEGSLRELFGSRFMLGNYVTLDLDDGSYAVLAHLRRGSAQVRRGQRVRRGDVLARCGNSGNSTEPHVHFQLMDHRIPVIAAGLPFTFPDGIPANDEFLDA